MTELLGNEITESCNSVLTAENGARRNLVIIMLTVDETGFSRVCLLSPFQILSTSRSQIYFDVYSGSRTKKNLDRTQKATLIMSERSGLLYVNGETKYMEDLDPSDKNSQSLYSLKVLQVFRDASEAVPINSEMTFDTSVIGSDYQKNFQLLRSRIG
jgi:hypothetical protein